MVINAEKRDLSGQKNQVLSKKKPLVLCLLSSGILAIPGKMLIIKQTNVSRGLGRGLRTKRRHNETEMAMAGALRDGGADGAMRSGAHGA